MNAIMNSQRDVVMRRLEADSSIPSLPYAVDVLLDSLADENMDFSHLAETVGNFPDITARLIFLANSAWACPTKAIVELERVCARLGFSMVRSISIAMVVSSAFDASRCPGFVPERYWTTALLSARLIPMLIRRGHLSPLQSPESLTTAGLLHNIGLLWLADNMPDQTSQALAAVEADPTISLRDALLDTAGLDYCMVGACMARVWQFPDLLVVSMENHADPHYRGELQDEVHLVGSAARMVSSLKLEDSNETVAALASNLGVSSQDTDSLYEFLKAQQVSVGEMARTLFC